MASVWLCGRDWERSDVAGWDHIEHEGKESPESGREEEEKEEEEGLLPEDSSACGALGGGGGWENQRMID